MMSEKQWGGMKLTIESLLEFGDVGIITLKLFDEVDQQVGKTETYNLNFAPKY
ncbi:hypothetical protein KAR34_10180 [bacterium]|nr:hypothetical protein [bacterium]